MKVTLCIVLAALFALASAECELPYRQGDVCDPEFCENLNTSMKTCKEELKKDFAPQSEDANESGNDEDAKKKHDGCKKMFNCVVNKIGEDNMQYKNIVTFCTLTTSENNHDENKDGRRNFDMCVGFNGMQCCNLMEKHGGHFPGHHGGPPAKAPENQPM